MSDLGDRTRVRGLHVKEMRRTEGHQLAGRFCQNFPFVVLKYLLRIPDQHAHPQKQVSLVPSRVRGGAESPRFPLASHPLDENLPSGSRCAAPPELLGRQPLEW